MEEPAIAIFHWFKSNFLGNGNAEMYEFVVG